MAKDWSESQNPYTVLQLENGPNSTKEEIKKAYFKMALLKHPDKNKNNPNANEEFAELHKALDVLNDKDARAALDDLLRAREARDARLSQQDSKRQKMRQDLERREQQAFSEKSELEVAKAQLMKELQRLRRKAQEQETQKMAAAAQARAEGRAAAAAAANPGQDPELQDTLQRSLKVSWTLTDGDYSEQQLRQVFEQHGPVENVKKLEKKKKKQKMARALVVMGSVASAQSALNSACGDIKNPLLVLPAEKASSAPAPVNPPCPPPWPAYSPPSSSAPFTSPPLQRPLFPGGASAQSNGSGTFASKPASINSFASFEAAILARCRQQGQQQKAEARATQQGAQDGEKPGLASGGEAEQQGQQQKAEAQAQAAKQGAQDRDNPGQARGGEVEEEGLQRKTEAKAEAALQEAEEGEKAGQARGGEAERRGGNRHEEGAASIQGTRIIDSEAPQVVA